jgi:hypothetical protein
LGEDRKTFSEWAQKHLKPFAVKSARNTPLTLDEATTLRIMSPIMWEGIALCGREMSHSENQGLFSRLLCS